MEFETISGCSLIVTLLTQVFKQYLPNSIDTKWLALIFSIIVGGLRMYYMNQFDIEGILNVFILLATSIGIYEIGDTTTNKLKQKGGK